ncbi:MAG: malonyl-ACP O-methyltransferase BioC [PVC group bacterium]|nr:malonyl-ACP O-methyltransferase BioC [PVC group bacterium]
MSVKELIRNNFSKSASSYDAYAQVQNLCARELAQRINIQYPGTILDVGCGTGNFSQLLRTKFAQAKITGVDISEEMIQHAKIRCKQDDIKFIVADAERMDCCERFDLITSNATMQWFEDLPEVLNKYKNMLEDQGMIIISLFGPQTFRELNVCLQSLWGTEDVIYSQRFLDQYAIEVIFKKFFQEVLVEKIVHKECFDNVWDMLCRIKYTGVRGNSFAGGSLWTPNRIKQLEDIYRDKFKRIEVTYEMFFCRGGK